MDLTSLISGFGGIAHTLLFFIVALSIIVAVHEYGHYIVGRWSGIKAEVFSIGFGPVLASRTDRHGTRWQIAALPLGGYVKFLGDASAVSDKAAEEYDKLDEATKRHTMHGAPLWARAATVAAGPIFNFVLSILVFTALIMVRGEAADPLTVERITPLPAEVQELEPGDAIIGIGGERVASLEELGALLDRLPAQPTLDYTVLRDGEEMTVQGPYPFPPMIASLQPRSAAMDIGLETGDVIVEIDGEPVFAFEQLQQAVTASEGRPLQITVWRDGEMLDFVLAPRRVDLPRPEGGFETRWLIGITGGFFFEAATEPLGPLEALNAGIAQTWFIITASLSGLWHMITGAISSCNLSGPIGIAETSGAMAAQGASSFLWFVAVLSTAVGLLNLFPIPVLDGGHLVFHAYEALRGRPPSDRALQVLMAAGLSVIALLMATAIGADLFCP